MKNVCRCMWVMCVTGLMLRVRGPAAIAHSYLLVFWKRVLLTTCTKAVSYPVCVVYVYVQDKRRGVSRVFASIGDVLFKNALFLKHTLDCSFCLEFIGSPCRKHDNLRERERGRKGRSRWLDNKMYKRQI